MSSDSDENVYESENSNEENSSDENEDEDMQSDDQQSDSDNDRVIFSLQL